MSQNQPDPFSENTVPIVPPHGQQPVVAPHGQQPVVAPVTTPYGSTPQYAPPPGSTPMNPAYTRPAARTNGLAVASMIFGFVAPASWMLFWLWFIPVLGWILMVAAPVAPLLAVIFGHIATSQIKRTGDSGRGMAITGLIFGYVAIAFTLLALAAAAIIFGGLFAFATSTGF
ncbi:DUF4190 domain-containing protein [Microbacterium amylolyticum]|uniref:DUF4190 domain-containing protein n=1 Tax=Microbacterium amylolyticum TaxID=936337 RepID=A0ABS4ZDX5_9MICO|nr:DUF4190 domain-containing protein [Microbacterium amylolyticum]MBP2435437.1 hypothetical protein [Microbacterium amylolyticum]